MRNCLPALAAALLAACATLTPPAPPKMDLPTAFRHALPDADAVAAAQPQPDPKCWWSAFGDVTLDRLVATALADNPRIRAAQEHLDSARMLVGPTRARYKPGLTAHTVSSPNLESTASYLQFGVESQWDLGLFGRAASEKRLARLSRGDAAAELDALRVAMQTEVVHELVALRSARRQTELREQLASARAEALALVERQRGLGLASAAEVERARIALATAQAQGLDPVQIADASETRLAVLFGRTEPDPALAAGPPLHAARVAFAALPADLLRTRVDVRRAELAVRKAAAELDLARADRWPQVTLAGAITFSAKIDGDELLAPRRLSSIGPGITIPLFDWGARAARAQARGAELAAAADAYRATVLGALGDAETALGAVQRAAERAALAAGAQESADRIEAAAAKRRALGLADRTEVVAAHVAALEAALATESTQEAHAQAIVALYQALGGAALPAANGVARAW